MSVITLQVRDYMNESQLVVNVAKLPSNRDYCGVDDVDGFILVDLYEDEFILQFDLEDLPHINDALNDILNGGHYSEDDENCVDHSPMINAIREAVIQSKYCVDIAY